ncbi:2Fe-2S ferredoxin [Rhizobium sp. ACO-34A]|nr:DUF1284 domain-containing protein [Rhizobium sp. ACO-34A]ATN33816.1 2Fe-2S ferredoxin [Rhizobium sp. ACO-34A]
MAIRLRPHHLLCMLTFVGRGYSPRFIANYEVLARRLSRGETILIVEGADDICAPLLEDESAPHCLGESVCGRDTEALAAVSELLGRPLSAGSSIVPGPNLFGKLRLHFSSGGIRTACNGCEWGSLCDHVAEGGYREVRIR